MIIIRNLWVLNKGLQETITWMRALKTSLHKSRWIKLWFLPANKTQKLLKTWISKHHSVAATFSILFPNEKRTIKALPEVPWNQPAETNGKRNLKSTRALSHQILTTSKEFSASIIIAYLALKMMDISLARSLLVSFSSLTKWVLLKGQDRISRKRILQESSGWAGSLEL